MKLQRFRVKNFRSVKDSAVNPGDPNKTWIEVDKDVTVLIGENESGKTNLLLALRNLGPDRGDAIKKTDYPKGMGKRIGENQDAYPFVIAEFDTGDLSARIAEIAKIKVESAKTVRITRYWGKKYSVSFPEYKWQGFVHSGDLAKEIRVCLDAIESAPIQETGNEADPAAEVEATRQKRDLKSGLLEVWGKYRSGTRRHRARTESKEKIPDYSDYAAVEKRINTLVAKARAEKNPYTSHLEELIERLTYVAYPGHRDDVFDAVTDVIPALAYLSEYDGLDSAIDLSVANEILQSEDQSKFGLREIRKADTVDLLLRHVGLNVQMLLALGDSGPGKDERYQALKEAGRALSNQFNKWWKQGRRNFEMGIDGNHFRVWVSDNKRETPVELENRSAGLLWFLNFYLALHAASRGKDEGAVLLLDEPGMSLHPNAQRDMSCLFDYLGKKNQIIYTSHSPFLINAGRLDRARKVYTNASGNTKATANLHYTEESQGDHGSAYAVHSALGLGISESLLVGCCPILVEGKTDQYYLAAIRILLIAQGKFFPQSELAFFQADGADGMSGLARVVAGRPRRLPVLLLDSDSKGDTVATDLVRSGLYADHEKKILRIQPFTKGDLAESTVEDLIPTNILEEQMDELQLEDKPGKRLSVDPRKPFVAQVLEWWGRAHPGRSKLDLRWKAPLALGVHQRLLDMHRNAEKFDPETVEKWTELFQSFEELSTGENELDLIPTRTPSVEKGDGKKYRRLKTSNTYHWCRNCPRFPGDGYVEFDRKPRSGEPCQICAKKEKGRTCSRSAE